MVNNRPKHSAHRSSSFIRRHPGRSDAKNLSSGYNIRPWKWRAAVPDKSFRRLPTRSPRTITWNGRPPISPVDGCPEISGSSLSGAAVIGLPAIRPCASGNSLNVTSLLSRLKLPACAGPAGKTMGIAAGATERVDSGPKPIQTGKRQPVLFQIVNLFSLPYLERVHVCRVGRCNRRG